MLAFIFQSIGTQELILIGIIALIFLGPRKLPEYARKIGKVMSDLRNTTSEFRSTWEREVNFEEEAKALQLESIEREADEVSSPRTSEDLPAPAIRAVSEDELTKAKATAAETPELNGSEADEDAELDKRNWL
mgnify:CR=1 FL=1